MQRSKLSWEEVMEYEKIKEYGGIYYKNGKYYLVQEIGGSAPVLIVHEIPIDLYELLTSGRKTERDISYYLREDRWPPTEEELEEANRKFIRNRPGVLIENPESCKHFTFEELEELIPLAEKEYIKYEGRLPWGYESPLKKRGFLKKIKGR